MIRELHEALVQVGAEVVGHRLFIKRLSHAPEPLIALALGDREGHVPCPKHGVAILLNIELRAAKPAAEKLDELLARGFEARGMERAHVRRFGGRIHEVVEAVHHALDALGAADGVVVSGRGFRHVGGHYIGVGADGSTLVRRHG